MKKLEELSEGASEKSPNISSKLGCCCCCVFCCAVVEGGGCGRDGLVVDWLLPKLAAAPRSTSFEGLEELFEVGGAGEGCFVEEGNVNVSSSSLSLPPFELKTKITNRLIKHLIHLLLMDEAKRANTRVDNY